MISEIPKTSRGKLDPTRQAGFLADVEAGYSDSDLARRFGLSERTATNWRIRLFGRRQKQKNPQPLQGLDGGLSDLSTGVIQQNQKNDTTPSPDAGGTGEPDGGK